MRRPPPAAEDVPAETKAKVAEVKKGLADGSFVIWKGPMSQNQGQGARPGEQERAISKIVLERILDAAIPLLK